MSKKISLAATKAIFIGVMCSVSYFAVYVARNILSAVTPSLLEDGFFLKDEVGTLSSAYFITYAVGQLINGAIGDKIKAKYMICFGLLLAGVCNILFPYIVTSKEVATAAYAASGFFLSMIYGPMTKIIAENTEPHYATRCSLGYTFASFFGSPSAGVLAAFLTWQSVFVSSASILFLMATVCFFVFSLFEKKGYIKYNQYDRPKSADKTEGIRILINHRIIRFSIVSIITGVIRTTVVFWMPTYFNDYLGYSSDDSALIFTVTTFIISLTAFISVFLYERLGRNMDKTMLISFIAATIFFIALYFVKHPIINIGLIVLGVMGSNCAATMLWSRYCPSLRDTGMVSAATGFIDFVSYMAASASSKIFGSAVGTIGWSGLILIWIGLMAIGVVVMATAKKGTFK